jgi:5-methylcytosine-specific restriction protein B
MVKEDILKAFSSFSKFMDAATIPGYYRDTNRSSLLQSGTATRSNTAWKKCEYIIAYLDDETSKHPLEDYIEGWRKITKNYDGQILFLEESKDVWGMYNNKGDHIGDTSKITSFLSKMAPKSSKIILSVDFNWSLFSEACLKSGLIFSDQTIQRFIASLCTKPFVICSGLSGSGKTKLTQAFAQWITENESQYAIVPVGADWTNREPLLGYPNALNKEEYVSPENGVLDLMIRAKQNIESTEEPTKPYFLILDEMNLSHVERYFADFLSTMESGDKITLHKIENGSLIVPSAIKLPKNLFIVGTVNIDETTYMFSPKVLDRANTIEFRLTEEDLEDFIKSDVKLDMDLLKAQGANMSDSFMAMALKVTDKNLKSSEADLKLFFSELKKSGAEFGYRTASEIGRLMYMLEELGESGDNLLDIAIMQKLLPKLHGSRNKLTKVLPILGGFCLTDNSKIKEDYLDKFVSNSLTEVELKADTNIKYKISFEKICRMYKNAVENGFASYAEA